MTTLNKLVYLIKDLRSGGIASDDSTVSNRMLAEMIHVERAMLVKQDMDKNRLVPEVAVQSLGCIPLEGVNSVTCCNINLRIPNSMLRTGILPTPIALHYGQGSGNLFTFVGSPDYNKAIGFTTETAIRWQGFRKYASSYPASFYRDRRLYVANAPEMEYLGVRGIFENPEEAAKFVPCDEENCWDWDSEYPIAQYHVSALVQLVAAKYLALLGGTYQDKTNDSNDNAPTRTNEP